LSFTFGRQTEWGWTSDEGGKNQLTAERRREVETSVEMLRLSVLKEMTTKYKVVLAEHYK
jgi:hypothetical protein